MKLGVKGFDLIQLIRVKKYEKVFSYTKYISLDKSCNMSLIGDHPWETYHYAMGIAICISMGVTMMSLTLKFIQQ